MGYLHNLHLDTSGPISVLFCMCKRDAFDCAIDDPNSPQGDRFDTRQKLPVVSDPAQLWHAMLWRFKTSWVKPLPEKNMGCGLLNITEWLWNMLECCSLL